ncbi:MAG: leucyl aminopeptidase [Synergistaceae bacterium]|nr:leucyl aminopeptidase [Synergistaceae bacterium]
MDMAIDVSVLKEPAEDWKGDALLLLAGEGGHAEIAPPSLVSYIKTLEERGDFEGKKGSLMKVPVFGGGVKNLYLAGLGKTEEFTHSLLRDALVCALRKIGRERGGSVLVIADKTGPDADVILGEAAELAGYVFDKYKKKDENNDDGKFSLRKIFAPRLDEKKVALGRIFGESQRFARDLANEPGNVINPVTLADTAARFAKERGLTCEVWDEERLAAERMGALLAVGRGSAVPPRLIHLTYSPKVKTGKNPKKIVFVGKGITFDSGGLDLKPSDFLKTMKGDKSGACCVLGVMKGAAALGLDAEVHGIIAAAENMPGGNSFRPDDIIEARNGKTIEIDNTDAEGRLVLADALVLACELKPDVIIDMATLTGACAVALGSWTSGLFTADEALCEALLDSARKRGERLWRLPMDDEKIGESLKSKFADLINSGSRYGGATFGAMFLAEFVEKGIPWAHIDMAGTDFMKEESGVYSKGASAWGVRTCLDYLAGMFGVSGV